MVTKFEIINNAIEYYTSPGANYGIDRNNGSCKYRTQTGFKCVIGCSIPDNVFIEEMNNYIATDLIKEYKVIQRIFAGIDNKFLDDLQALHDRHAFDERPLYEFVSRLKEQAEQYKEEEVIK